MGTKCYAVQYIVNGEETPKTAPTPWDFVTLPEDERATAIGNMHSKIGKHRGGHAFPVAASRTWNSLPTSLTLLRWRPSGVS